jgi:hypothetical protein
MAHRTGRKLQSLPVEQILQLLALNRRQQKLSNSGIRCVLTICSEVPAVDCFQLRRQNGRYTFSQSVFQIMVIAKCEVAEIHEGAVRFKCAAGGR